jgi:hypothetical protein
VEKGGKVILQKGDLSHTGGNVVEVSNGTFTVNGGTISGAGTSKKAIVLENGAIATLSSDEIVTKNTAEWAINGDIEVKKGETGATASSLKITKGVINGAVTVDGGSSFTLTDGTVGNVTLTDGSFTQAKGTSGDVTATKGSFTLTTGVTGALTVANATAEIKDGYVKSIADASTATAASKINIKGGKIGAIPAATEGGSDTYSATAITLSNGASVIVTAGEITGSTTAVSVVKGSLEVSGTGTPVLTGATVISTVPATAGDAKVTLSAANAQYVSTNQFALWNSSATTPSSSSFTAGSTPAATMSVKAGYFTGDVASDAAKYFITGGYFKNCGILNVYGSKLDWFQTNFGLGAGDADTGYSKVIGKEN